MLDKDELDFVKSLLDSGDRDNGIMAIAILRKHYHIKYIMEVLKHYPKIFMFFVMEEYSRQVINKTLYND